MKIAVLSDTHSREFAVRRALALLEPYKVDAILHCGDLDDAETVALFPPGTHFVFGNCDHDRVGIRAAVQSLGATLHEPFGHLELAGKNIAFVHGDDARMLHDLEHADAFDFVFYGHSHIAREHRTGRTRVINPGALHRANPKTFLVLDLDSGHAETVAVD